MRLLAVPPKGLEDLIPKLILDHLAKQLLMRRELLQKAIIVLLALERAVDAKGVLLRRRDLLEVLEVVLGRLLRDEELLAYRKGHRPSAHPSLNESLGQH